MPYVNAQNAGLANVEEGDINGKSFLIETKSIGRSCFNKDPSVRLLRHEYSKCMKNIPMSFIRIYSLRRISDIQISQFVLSKLDTMNHPINYNAYQDDNQYRSLHLQSKQGH
ncbi:unnamed protein product, partial [Rotaria magnacalcarata]